MAYHDSTTASGSSATPAVAVPNGGGGSPLQADDIVILTASIDSGSADFQTGDWPTGFTELQDKALTIDGHRAAVGWKRLTGADVGSYTFGNLGASGDWVCQAFAFRGRHTTNPPVASLAFSDTSNGTPLSINAATVTAVDGDDLLWISAPDVEGSGWGTGHTAPASYTEAEDAENAWTNLSGAYRNNVAAGATGTVTGTFTMEVGSTAGWSAFLVRIPAAAGGGGGDAAAPVVRLNTPSPLPMWSANRLI